MTLGQFIADQGYSQDFVDRHLLPSAGAIWSSPPRQMLDYPARAFLTFFDNHGLLKFVDRPQWRTVVGGSREYVQRLIADGPHARADRMSRHFDRALERWRRHCMPQNGFHETFDHVVIAAHADQALAMLDDPAPDERQCLQAFRYTRNRAVLHRDETFMPRRRWLWSSWNYLSDAGARHCRLHRHLLDERAATPCRPTPISSSPSIRTANRRDGTIERDLSYDHPVFTPETARVQRQIWSLQGRRRTWFCGAHFGAGFHEDGLQAGLAVAEQLGGVKRPWLLADPSTPHPCFAQTASIETRVG